MFVLALAMGLTGCATVGYYSHIINGHHALVEAEEDIEDILADHKYDEKIRARLSRALEIRQFASARLGLPDNDSYKTFVKLDRPYPVWNVIAAKPFSVQARQWCFFIVGCISYRGYFNKQEADAKAEELKAEGADVYVAGAPAYSTLGWFDDPLLSSMLYKNEAHLAGIIFHELAHQKVYIDDDSSFNEAFATAVELEGVRRWLNEQGDKAAIQEYRRYKDQQRHFNQLLQVTREALKKLYSKSHNKPVMLKNKQIIIAGMKHKHQELKRQWGGKSRYDKWMNQDINNAHLALVATYHELVSAFETLLRQQNNDLDKFYAEVERVGGLTRGARRKLLSELSQKVLMLDKNL